MVWSELNIKVCQSVFKIFLHSLQGLRCESGAWCTEEKTWHWLSSKLQTSEGIERDHTGGHQFYWFIPVGCYSHLRIYATQHQPVHHPLKPIMYRMALLLGTSAVIYRPKGTDSNASPFLTNEVPKLNVWNECWRLPYIIFPYIRKNIYALIHVPHTTSLSNQDTQGTRLCECNKMCLDWSALLNGIFLTLRYTEHFEGLLPSAAFCQAFQLFGEKFPFILPNVLTQDRPSQSFTGPPPEASKFGCKMGHILYWSNFFKRTWLFVTQNLCFK